MTTLGTGALRIRHWLRAHPLALDGALALGVLVAMVFASFVDPGGHDGPTFGARTPPRAACC